MSIFSNEIIKKIVQAADIDKSDLVLLHFWGDDNNRDVLFSFEKEIASIGASPFILQQSRDANAEIFNGATDTTFNEKYYNLFSCVDTVIDICMYQPVIPSPSLSKEKFNLYRTYMAKLFEKLKEKKKFLQIRIPTEQYAKELNLSPEKFINNMIDAYDIDYNLLKHECLQKVEEIKDKNKVCIKTGDDYELRLSLDNRKWYIDAGDGDLPCGEISIAPVEEETNGKIFFEKIKLDDDLWAENVVIEVNKGKIISSDSETFNKFVKELPPNGDVIGELGIGMNKNVTELIGYEGLDEKMFGTFHIGIGMNTLFGGKNESIAHMDFIGNGQVLFS